MKKLRKAFAFLLSLGMVIGTLALTNFGSIEASADTSNTVTVYYNNSWSNAYIHYQQANGSWTSVPGEEMTETSDVSGYKWKATIDLGSNSSTQVCFNDGNNTWDSQNGANYTVSTGTWGIKDGQAQAITSTTTPSPTPTATPDTEKTLYFNNYYAKWDNVYAYVWNNDSDATEFQATIYDTVAKTYQVKITGSYQYVIFKNTSTTWDKQTVDLEIPTDYKNCYKPTGTENRPNGYWYEYSDTAFECSLEIGLTSPQTVGTTIPLIGETYDMLGHRYNFYYFMIHKQGAEESTDQRMYASPSGSYQYTSQWNPTEAGTYEVSFYAQQYSGFTAVDTKTFVISPQVEENTVTIYYANSSFSNANIHYKVGNGDWTDVPGVAMTQTSEKSGYTWKYVIEVEDENPQVTVCFNNGSGVWDSKNGENYTVNSSVAGIKDGSVYVLD